MKKIFFATFILGLSGCVHEGTVSDIDVGMSRSDIMKAMGKPDSDRMQGILEQMTYHQRRTAGWSVSRRDYTIILLNNAVVEINAQS